MQNKRLKILQSAISTVTRYGYRRTSMEDIAKEAGISRAAIYQIFANKEAVTVAALELLNDQGFEVAHVASDGIEQPVQKLSTYLSAYMAFYYQLVVAGPHADELMQIKTQFSTNNSQSTRQKLISNINQLLALSANAETGYILVAAAEGIKLSARNEDELKNRIAILVERFLN